MARKRPQKKVPTQRTPPSAPGAPKPAADPRALEKTMSDLGRLFRDREFASADEADAFMRDIMASGRPPSAPGRTPVDKAQDIMYQAWDAEGVRRIRLARKALTVSKDCADAYVLLAEEAAKDIHAAMRLYEQGIAAGERALGAEYFEENAGHFWGLIETRTYMRARDGLAGCFCVLGHREEAAAHYLEMMRLNSRDNQGVRYVLANLLLELRRYDELMTLLDAHADEQRAALLYTRALALFEQQGPGDAADAQLKTALGTNAFVPDYLLGKRALPRELPSHISLGQENEAVVYAADARAIWERNPKALAWLIEVRQSM